MADLVIIATPGAANANSYMTISQLRTVANMLPQGRTITHPDCPILVLSQLLVYGTLRIDAVSYFKGDASSKAQALKFPRSGLWEPGMRLELADDVIPAFLERALALWCIANRSAVDIDMGTADVTRVKTGFVEVEFGRTAAFVDMPEEVSRELYPYVRGMVARGPVLSYG